MGALMGASINAALRQQEKPYNRPDGRGNAFPLWWLAPPPSPTSWWDYKAPLCCELLMKGLLFRALFCPRLRGKSGAAGKGEASAASQSAECLSYHMTLKVNPVTLTLYSSPEGRYHNPRPERPSNLRTLRTLGTKSRQPSHRRRVQKPRSGPFKLSTFCSKLCEFL